MLFSPYWTAIHWPISSTHAAGPVWLNFLQYPTAATGADVAGEVYDRAFLLKQHVLRPTRKRAVNRPRLQPLPPAESCVTRIYRKLGRSLPVSLRSPYILDIYFKAIDRYVPKPYGGAAVLFQEQNSHDFGTEWSDLLPSMISVHQIPGDHTALVDEPHARAWAERLDDLLTVARERDMTFVK
jgi:hypothetical protein